MLSHLLFSLALGTEYFAATSNAAVVPAKAATPAKYTDASAVSSAVAAIQTSAGTGQAAASAYAAVLAGIVPASKPSSVAQALSAVAAAHSAYPTDLLQRGAALVLAGVAPGNLSQIVDPYSTYNNQNNNNPPPPTTIYPKKNASDAPYDLSEQDLRSRIYIPPSFTYGKKQPVIFIPGTGGYAGSDFGPNFGKVLTGSEFADPVYLNIPDNSLDDVQTNAEYVSYAINYISSVANRTTATLGWSQSALSVRWSAKYWPSTKEALSVQVQISPDYHGTVLAYLLALFPLPPALIQQEYGSTFVATLRNHGGDSAYTPVTSIYSQFDEIVQPQIAGPGASGYTNDARGVGVTNEFLQDTCTVLQPGGTVYNTHEGVLYNALAHALANDTLKTGSNGKLADVNPAAQCLKPFADGLTLEDIIATEATIPLAAINTLTYPNLTYTEPQIKAYARKDIPAGYSG